MISDKALIEEAVDINHRQVSEATTTVYAAHLQHYSQYLASAHGETMLTAQRKHVLLFLQHLQVHGGPTPHRRREPCSWCQDRAYPDGREGKGWSPSRCKSYMAALRFLYTHVIMEEDLPDLDPTSAVENPKLVEKHQFVPTRDEVRALFDAPGAPRDRVLVHWMYYAPSRRETFRQARWEHILGLDTDEATWLVPCGKGGKPTEFILHPILRNELRRYRRWQDQQAESNRALRNALTDSDTAYVLMTQSGLQMHSTTLTKMVKWRAVRAGIALKRCDTDDGVNGWTSRLTPHALRRAWATHALNDEDNPVPLDVVSAVLDHADVRTTRLYYARTKDSRAVKALRKHRL